MRGSNAERAPGSVAKRVIFAPQSPLQPATAERSRNPSMVPAGFDRYAGRSAPRLSRSSDSMHAGILPSTHGERNPSRPRSLQARTCSCRRRDPANLMDRVMARGGRRGASRTTLYTGRRRGSVVTLSRASARSGLRIGRSSFPLQSRRRSLSDRRIGRQKRDHLLPEPAPANRG